MLLLFRQSFYLFDQLNFQFASVDFQYKLDIQFEVLLFVDMMIQVHFLNHLHIYRIHKVFHLNY